MKIIERTYLLVSWLPRKHVWWSVEASSFWRHKTKISQPVNRLTDRFLTLRESNENTCRVESVEYFSRPKSSAECVCVIIHHVQTERIFIFEQFSQNIDSEVELSWKSYRLLVNQTKERTSSEIQLRSLGTPSLQSWFVTLWFSCVRPREKWAGEGAIPLRWRSEKFPTRSDTWKMWKLVWWLYRKIV